MNAIPVFIASNPEWAKKFTDAGVPIVGDDIKSQVGATITHRLLARLFEDRGLAIDNTYQLNFGGNMDFKNMLERERLLSKKISKTQSVTSQIDQGIEADDVHIGPSDHVPWLNDRKWAYIRLEGRNFGDVPLNIELKLEVWDSPNSAGVIIDAVRCAKLALDRGIGGPLGPSAYFMKSPPVQYHDDEAHRMIEEFAAGGTVAQSGVAASRRSPHLLSGSLRSPHFVPAPTYAPRHGDRRGGSTARSRSRASGCSSSAAAAATRAVPLRAGGRDGDRRRHARRTHIADARAAAEAAEVRLELHAGDLADLAFLRADSVDLAFSDGALARSRTSTGCSARCTACCATGAPFVFSLPHPFALGTETEPRPRARCRSAAPSSPARTSTPSPDRHRHRGRAAVCVTRHTLAEVFTGLSRTGFRVDTLLEPEPTPRPRRPRAAAGDGRLARPQGRFVSARIHQYRAACVVDGLDRGRVRAATTARTRCAARPSDVELDLSGDRRVPRRPDPAQPRAAAPRGRGLVPAARVPRGRGPRPASTWSRYEDDAEADMPEDDPPDAHHRDPAAAPHHRRSRDRAKRRCTGSSRSRTRSASSRTRSRCEMDIAGDDRLRLTPDAPGRLDAPVRAPIACRPLRNASASSIGPSSRRASSRKSSASPIDRAGRHAEEVHHLAAVERRAGSP